MIKETSKLSIVVLPIECLQVREYQIRDIDLLVQYYHMLLQHPEEYLGLVYTRPSRTHERMFEIFDGYRRFCAYIMAGRRKVLCVVEEEQEKEEREEARVA